jgi:WD40 repeat protein
MSISPQFLQEIKRTNKASESSALTSLITKEEVTFAIVLEGEDLEKALRVVTGTNDGFIKMNEVELQTNSSCCKQSFMLTQSGVSVGCKLSGQDSFAIACTNNMIYIFSFQTGTRINEFMAHDDFINCLLFHESKLVSCSMDTTIRIWDLKKMNYQDDPLVIYDHDDEIVSADIRHRDSLLVTMDA